MSESDLPINKSTTFAAKVRNCSDIIAEIDVVTKMQPKGHTLAAFCADVDDLIEVIAE